MTVTAGIPDQSYKAKEKYLAEQHMLTTGINVSILHILLHQAIKFD